MVKTDDVATQQQSRQKLSNYMQQVALLSDEGK
jgi:hypothetical protein